MTADPSRTSKTASYLQGVIVARKIGIVGGDHHNLGGVLRQNPKLPNRINRRDWVSALSDYRCPLREDIRMYSSNGHGRHFWYRVATVMHRHGGLK